MDKRSTIAIIGAGAWGLSTALHLVEAGYKNVVVFERAEKVPSPYSAANDLNKIIRAEYEDPFYTELTLVSRFTPNVTKHSPADTQRKKAMEGWKTPLFGPYFHQTGYLNSASGAAPQKSIDTLTKNLKSLSSSPPFAGQTSVLSKKEDFRKVAWQLTGPLDGFRGYFNRLAGYAHSANALKGIQQYCASKGVRFLLGEKIGKVDALLYDPSRRCAGVRTADGERHAADRVVCALGANNAGLVPEVANFTVARCWSVAHVQLTEEETDLLRGIPVVNVRDLGFYFEPDPATRLFKLCPLGAGFTNTDAEGTSLPPTDAASPGWAGFIPPEDERKLRTLLRQTLPWMADRPFVDNKFCWFSDTSDSEYCIDFVPGTSNSVIVLAGDSGHGFKMMPIVGSWVRDLLETGQQRLSRWQWKAPEAAKAEWGNAVSWRVGAAREMRELIEEHEKSPQPRL